MLLSKVLTSAVYTAVAETIKKQRMDHRGKASIVKYGFPNKGYDYENLFNLLSNMRCTRHGRISSTPQSNEHALAKLRPLKVELQ